MNLIHLAIGLFMYRKSLLYFLLSVLSVSLLFSCRQLSSQPQTYACDTMTTQRVELYRSDASKTIKKQSRYTQGLLVHQGNIYESTGYWGYSGIYLLHQGRTDDQLVKLDDQYFGEGLTFFNDTAFQLTWRAGKAFSYRFDSSQSSHFQLQKTFSYAGEGWGLTTLDQHLVMSDGSSNLRLIEPEDFSVKKVIAVHHGTNSVDRLNELESVKGLVLSNVYGKNNIIGINPTSGCVEAVVDAAPLVASVQAELREVKSPVCGEQCHAQDFVLNGIAYDADADEIYITGKNWPFIFAYDNFLKQASR